MSDGAVGSEGEADGVVPVDGAEEAEVAVRIKAGTAANKWMACGVGILASMA